MEALPLGGIPEASCENLTMELTEHEIYSMAILHVATTWGEFWMKTGKLRKLWKLASMVFGKHGMNWQLVICESNDQFSINFLVVRRLLSC